MTPEQEDALIYEALKEISQDGEMDEAIRLAIRAAYAQGREDAAKVCEAVNTHAQKRCDENGAELNYYDTGRATAALECAAAIRRGE